MDSTSECLTVKCSYSCILDKKVATLSEKVVLVNRVLSFGKEMIAVEREIRPSCLENWISSIHPGD